MYGHSLDVIINKELNIAVYDNFHKYLIEYYIIKLSVLSVR